MPVRLRATRRARPTYVKLGQTLSMRPDLIGASFIEQFKQLQDNVKPIASDEITAVITDTLGARGPL